MKDCKTRSLYVRGKFFIDPDYLSSSFACHRIMGTFPNGVESLCALPCKPKDSGSTPWSGFHSRVDAEKWVNTLNNWDELNLIDWSGDYPVVKTDLQDLVMISEKLLSKGQLMNRKDIIVITTNTVIISCWFFVTFFYMAGGRLP